MNNKFAVETMANAINDIILSKFRVYLKDRMNDPNVQAKINAKIDEIEATEDIVAEIESNVDFKAGDSISLNGIYFYYNKEKGELTTNNKVDIATNDVYVSEGLGYTWHAEELMRTRILAIISGLGEATFESTLKVVEDQIDFVEFLTLNNN